MLSFKPRFSYCRHHVRSASATAASSITDPDLLMEHALQNEDLEACETALAKGARLNRYISFTGTPLHAACQRNHLNIVQKLIDAGSDIEAVGIRGNTPLHVACQKSSATIALLLLSLKADPTKINHSGMTPLHFACHYPGNPSIVASLLLAGVDVNAKCSGDKNKTPLHFACHLGCSEIVSMLIEAGADIHAKSDENRTPLHYACSQGFVKIATVLIDAGADIHAKMEKNKTLLHYACSQGFVKIVSMLIDAGADVNAMSDDNRTPLAEAAMFCCYKDIIELLIQSGAHVDPLNTQLNSKILHSACEYNRGTKKTVDLMIAANADVNIVVNAYKFTPLHYACQRGKSDIVASLIGAGACVNATNANGNTALHFACEANCYQAVSLLIDAGADVNARGLRNVTPLYLACKYNNLDVVRKLIDAGADVNVKSKLGSIKWNPRKSSFIEQATYHMLRELDQCDDSTGEGENTPLHIASAWGNVDVMFLLFEAGADLDSVNICNCTPLSLACQQGRVHAAELLIVNEAEIDIKDINGNTILDLADSIYNDEVKNLIRSYTIGGGVTLKSAYSSDE